MTNTLANQILDQVRDGASYPSNIVYKALEMTGDIVEIYETENKNE